MDENRLHTLEVLSELFKSKSEVKSEIVNLNSILNLPKGTEHFISDIHGEYDTFNHIMNNCSGVIKEKINALFGDTLTNEEMNDFATLVYYPKEKLELLSTDPSFDLDKKKTLLFRLTKLAALVSVKYTRSKVKKALPRTYSYIIEEMMFAVKDDVQTQIDYHNAIFESVIKIGAFEEVVIAYSDLIKTLAVDMVHILGDVFDRGPRADKVVNALLATKEKIDFEWGNHDVLFMGAASLNPVCLMTVCFLSLKYNNYHVLENGYGLSLRNLIDFANKYYKEKDSIKNALKASAILMFKLEGLLIKKHPEYGLSNRLFLEQINYDDHSIIYEGNKLKLDPSYFVHVNKENPYSLDEEENHIVESLIRNAKESILLNKHIDFLYTKGSSYKIYNGNLLFHGCIPIKEDLTLLDVEINGEKYKGKELMDKVDSIARDAYYHKNANSVDYMWYLWCGINSPFSGRNVKMFESILLDKEYRKEPRNAYFNNQNNIDMFNLIAENFGLDKNKAHIINGHTPIETVKGDSPIKCGGKLLVIDGGFAKAYHEKTGIAGYTLFFDSHGMYIKAHESFSTIKDAIMKNEDISSKIQVVETFDHRMLVKETYIGQKLQERIDDLKELLECYENGSIREKRM